MGFPRASWLVHRTVHTPARTWGDASVFPFFDGQGRVTHAMFVTAEHGDIALWPLRPGDVRVSLFRTVYLSRDPTALVVRDAADARMVQGLWHYDPWWLLADPSYVGHPAVPHLKATNCVPRFMRPITDVAFTEDLSRVSGLIDDSGNPRFEPGADLPARSPRVEPGVGAGGWVLDPVWAEPRRPTPWFRSGNR